MESSSRFRDRLSEITRWLRESFGSPAASPPHGVDGDRTSYALVVSEDQEAQRWVPTYTEPGWETSLASEAADAMELLGIEHYDLIVVDLRTPGVDSAKFVRDIRGHRQIPIMVAGLRTDRRLIADALKAGADEFLYIDGAPEASRLLLRHTVDRARMSAVYEKGHPEWERDFLTGADSRRAFSEIYAQRVEHSRQTGEGLVIIRLEVEDLERMNAAYDAHVGDTVLREVARMLRRAVRATDSVARLEAGQFAVLLAGANGRRAEQVANQIHALAAKQRFPERPGLRIRLRVGWAELGTDADPLEAAERRLGDREVSAT